MSCCRPERFARSGVWGYVEEVALEINSSEVARLMDIGFVGGRERHESIRRLEGRCHIFEKRAEGATVSGVVGRSRTCSWVRRIAVPHVKAVEGTSYVE